MRNACAGTDRRSGGQKPTAAVKLQRRRSGGQNQLRRSGGQTTEAAVKLQRRRSNYNGGGQLSDLQRCQVSLLASDRSRSSARNSSSDKYSNLCAKRRT